VVIWLNGAYGVGKTTVAKLLCAALPDAFLYNPENAGNFIRENLPDDLWRDNFEQYPLWRRLNADMLTLAASDSRTVIVPMTLILPESGEIFDLLRARGTAVRHIVLDADGETLLRRNLARGEAADSYCVRHIGACVAALARHPDRVDTAGRGAAEVAAGILLDVRR